MHCSHYSELSLSTLGMGVHASGLMQESMGIESEERVGATTTLPEQAVLGT